MKRTLLLVIGSFLLLTCSITNVPLTSTINKIETPNIDMLQTQIGSTTDTTISTSHISTQFSYFVYIGGQSNAVGADRGTKRVTLENPSKYTIESNNVQILNQNSTFINLTPKLRVDFQKPTKRGYEYKSFSIKAKFLDLLGLANPDKEIRAVSFALESAGFTNNFKLAPFGSEVITQLETRIKSLPATTGSKKLIFWHQGEADRNSDIYLESLATHIDIMRAYIGDMNTPVIVGGMLESWVQANNPKSQTILENIGNYIPYTAFASAKNLTGTPYDRIHFGANQMGEFAQRYFNKIVIAENNNSPVNYIQPVKGEYLIAFEKKEHTLTNTQFTTKYLEMMRYGNLTDKAYSRIGELWKYRNTDGFTFKYVIKVGTQTATIITKQAKHPLAIQGHNEAIQSTGEFVSFENTINGITQESIRKLPVYHVRNRGESWLYSDETPDALWSGIGTHTFTTGIPALIDKNEQNPIWADEVLLYAIVK